jgi:hypothetical protein
MSTSASFNQLSTSITSIFDSLAFLHAHDNLDDVEVFAIDSVQTIPSHHFTSLNPKPFEEEDPYPPTNSQHKSLPYVCRMLRQSYSYLPAQQP